MRDEGAIPGNGAASVPSYRFASPGWAVAALLAGLLLTAVSLPAWRGGVVGGVGSLLIGEQGAAAGDVASGRHGRGIVGRESPQAQPACPVLIGRPRHRGVAVYRPAHTRHLGVRIRTCRPGGDAHRP